ncbi:MAG: polyprenyl synthetase family protein [Bacteroidales bacterium]|nr:polyprenyl synthetase family protein [Bacteroidales bacterium]
MDLKLVHNELGNDWTEYERTLRDALKHPNQLLTLINNYIISNAGKQLRPALCILVAKLCGNVTNITYNCAAVCEIIHTATLLHDDVADNGNVRRGKPTVKAAFTPAASVLTGDYWLAQAMHLLIEKCNTDILSYFAQTIGELSEGEIIQMDKADKADTTMDDYYDIIARKTASLFIAAAKSGANSVNADAESISKVAQYAYHLGLAFQMKDDIFDYSPNLETGKIAGADLKERKITLPLLCAFANNPMAEKQIRELICEIENSPLTQTQISDKEKAIINKINEFVVENNGIEDSQKILENHVALAIEAIEGFKDCYAKKTLIRFAEYVGTRKV